MSMGKRIRRNGGAQDLFSPWRKYYCYLNNHNKARKKIKRENNKAERREWRIDG